jgi:hypothetical protein
MFICSYISIVAAIFDKIIDIFLSLSVILWQPAAKYPGISLLRLSRLILANERHTHVREKIPILL